MRIILLLLGIGFFFSCNKEATYNKRLNGVWTPVKIRIFTTGGFSYPGENITGEMKFVEEGDKTTKGDYQIKLELDYDDKHISIDDIGTYLIHENYVDRTSIDGQSFESKISYINKEDIDFEYRNSNIESLQIIAKKN